MRAFLKTFCIGGALAALLSAGTGIGIASLVPEPNPADYAVAESGPMAPAASVDTSIFDPDDVLSEQEEQLLLQDTATRLDAPQIVQSLHYIVFAENDENVNDTVEYYLREHHPELIGKDSFSPGVLIVGVGLDPRAAFIFAGDDVADALNLRSSGHLDDAIDAIKPGVRDNRIGAGLFAGADAATNLEKLAAYSYDSAKGDRTAGIFGGSFGVLAAALGASAWLGARKQYRENEVKKARENLQLVSSTYGSLAQRLDQINISAHSLTSEFADARLRQDWEEVRTRFLDIHQKVDAFNGLSPASSDREIYEQRTNIEDAAMVVSQVHHAETNIDTISRLERGDHVLRQQEVQALCDDAYDARLEVSSTNHPLYAALSEIIERAEQLTTQTASPDFLQSFITLQRDYQAALNRLLKEQFNDVNMKNATEIRSPRIYEEDYRPGYGLHGFVPFWTLSSWHTHNVQAQQASTSSSTNTSFSSGFSGAGGSSSF